MSNRSLVVAILTLPLGEGLMKRTPVVLLVPFLKLIGTSLTVMRSASGMRGKVKWKGGLYAAQAACF
jgi:hypothetical protein